MCWKFCRYSLIGKTLLWYRSKTGSKPVTGSDCWRSLTGRTEFSYNSGVSSSLAVSSKEGTMDTTEYHRFMSLLPQRVLDGNTDEELAFKFLHCFPNIKIIYSIHEPEIERSGGKGTFLVVQNDNEPEYFCIQCSAKRMGEQLRLGVKDKEKIIDQFESMYKLMDTAIYNKKEIFLRRLADIAIGWAENTLQHAEYTEQRMAYMQALAMMENKMLPALEDLLV